MGQAITPESITRVLSHPAGGLKNIPQGARRVALLNQADTPELQSSGGTIARELLSHFDSIIVGSLAQKNLQTIERCAGIILAAGESKRFGDSKQVLDWNGKPFVRHVAETALRAGLDPVVVVTGFDSARVESALAGLNVNLAHNPNYQDGQSASIKKGIEALPANVGSAIFLLADQPQIPADVVRALVESHSRGMQAILAPLVMEERRANPVLFDRVTFNDLLKLEGDVGGRAIFDKHRVEYLPWHDELLLFDVDQPEDYEKLKSL
jgi:molybdenum cofactor cytidylyltransferase